MWRTMVENEIMYTMTSQEYAYISTQAGVISLIFILFMGALMMFVYEMYIAKLKKKWGVVEKIERRSN
jgi:hypothetical protein